MSDPMFEYGSRWLKTDFHLHTRADKEFSYQGADNDYINNYVSALRDANINLGVITNHNKFDLDEFKAIRKKAKKSAIGLLPGVELSVQDGSTGIHTLIVFSDEWITNKENENYIQSFLNQAFAGTINFAHKNAHSNHNIEDTVHALDKFQKDYFIVFAHVESSNGLWESLSIGRISELFKKAAIRRRILGFQKVRTHNKRVKLQQALGDHYPAEVEGSDAKQFTDMSARNHVSYLKLGSFKFEAVKFALQDHTARLCLSPPKNQHAYIRKVRFDGAGTLGGTEISLSSELNTLIGIRGSGKSSVLEGIRYALNIPFGDKSSDKEYKEGLVQHLLRSGGKITIDAVDRRGQPYEIRRILNERADVYVNGQLQPGVSIRETILHQPIYFGQKDLSSTGAGFEKDLIEKLLGDALISVRQQIEDSKRQVTDAVKQIKRLNNAAEQKQEWLDKKQDTLFQLQFYEKHGIENKLQKQLDFDRDEQKAHKIIQAATNYLSDLNNFITDMEDELKNHLRYQSAQNQPFFEDFFSLYQQIINDFNRIKQAADNGQNTVVELQQKLTAFSQQKQALKEDFAAIERGLAKELQQAGAHAINPQAFKQLKSQLDSAEQMLEILSQSEQQYDNLQQSLTDKLNALDQLQQDEYQIIEQTLSKVNQQDSALKIIPAYKADKGVMLKYMQEIYRGSRIRETTLQSILKQYNDFSAIYQDKHNLRGLLAGSYDIFWQYFEDNLEALLTWQLPNLFTIEYHGKALAHHSLGQRASALMLFILNQQENDVVIIDQPEDDLDNQTIYADVIKLIRKLKPSTQFIFATHNANIPVLGDAEQVIACDYQDDQIALTIGSIDDETVQQRIVNIMEGGTEAFEKRKQVYDAWKSSNS